LKEFVIDYEGQFNTTQGWGDYNMKFKTGLGLFVAMGLVMTACSTTNDGGRRRVAGKSSGGDKPFSERDARILTDGELTGFSSSKGSMGIKNARLITDNFSAYESKLKIVNTATQTLSMVYYIYSDDKSSSEFTNAVIAAAKKGVKVTLLVDFLTNYERIDLFKYMQTKGNEGRGSLNVYFYGLPVKEVLKAAIFSTIPCPQNIESKAVGACAAAKNAQIEQMSGVETTWFSKLFLTGLYGKNKDLMSIAEVAGGQWSPEDMKKQIGSLSEKDQKKLKSVPGLVNAAKNESDLGAKLKLNSILSSNDSPVSQVLEAVAGIVPMNLGSSEAIKHITDYTHHKLIVADGARFQMGGRNIEDSYHTDGVSLKYTFMDSDFYAETPGASKIQASFDRLVEFRIASGGLVGDMSEVDRLVPNEYDVNTGQFQMAFQTCASGQSTLGQGTLEDCVNAEMVAKEGYQSFAARMTKVERNMKEKALAFADHRKGKSKYKFNWRPTQDDSISDSSAQAYYLENTPFSHANPSKRLFGSQIGKESENGKNIHAAWIRGIENTCAISAKGGERKKVVLHSAYFLLSSGLLNAIGNAINGTWDCHNVDILLVTNSFATTDLNVLNVFARYQLRALFTYERNHVNSRRASLNYYEYLPHTGLEEAVARERKAKGIPNDMKSLHTKISVLGDDIIIGSANADVRSYFMDTNNAILIRNAPGLVKDYLDYLKRSGGPKDPQPESDPDLKYWIAGLLLQPGSPPVSYGDVTDQHLDLHNRGVLMALQAHWDPEGKRMTQTRQDAARAVITKWGADIDKSTTTILNSDPVETKLLEKAANEFDKTWMTL
jgi:putative cardiolipin synthase